MQRMALSGLGLSVQGQGYSHRLASQESNGIFRWPSRNENNDALFTIIISYFD